MRLLFMTIGGLHSVRLPVVTRGNWKNLVLVVFDRDEKGEGKEVRKQNKEDRERKTLGALEKGTAGDNVRHSFWTRRKRMWGGALLAVLFLVLLWAGKKGIGFWEEPGLKAATYTAKDQDMKKAEESYRNLELDLQYELEHFESLYPGYDEYQYELDDIGHDPYVLISMLSALYGGEFTRKEAEEEIPELFEKQYVRTQKIEMEVRSRMETKTDSQGKEYEEEVSYVYSIYHVKLENTELSHLPVYLLDEEELGAYAAYMKNLGNRQDLFPVDRYPSASTVEEPVSYSVPREDLKDQTFADMLAEAEKYIGYPYVWGGSSPETSFDCSGFISWVLNHSGWEVGRLDTQGLYELCTQVPEEEAKPGDLVFFTGTYDTPGISHVGLYVGHGKMLHCGSPISYADLDTEYWQQHFDSYGRLP